MKRQVITQLTTAERLTLLEQIFAPQGECSCVEFASCTLSDMAFMFDFADANLVKMKWSNDECELSEIIERINHLLSPETEQKFELGMPYFIHAILPQEPILAQKVIHWLQYDEPIAMEHFVTTSDTDDITIRVAFIKNEIGNKIVNEIEKENRIINI
ncbi:MAG: hypothetical protein J6X81_04255 [Muribaculaceae bacterium]|nr:hypothetical protein [Muribaculaceae bacterium]